MWNTSNIKWVLGFTPMPFIMVYFLLFPLFHSNYFKKHALSGGLGAKFERWLFFHNLLNIYSTLSIWNLHNLGGPYHNTLMDPTNWKMSMLQTTSLKNTNASWGWPLWEWPRMISFHDTIISHLGILSNNLWETSHLGIHCINPHDVFGIHAIYICIAHKMHIT